VEENLRFVITGPNGFVGTNLRRFLNNKKISITSLSRKKHKRFKFEKTINISNLEQVGLANKLIGCDALIHLVGTGVQTADTDYQTVNVKLTNEAIKLCKRAKIKKFVYISGLGVNKSTTFGYFISKLKAEQQIIKSGLDYTILRASYIIGKDDPLTKNLTKQARNGSILIPGSGKYRLQPLSVDDVVKIILSSITDKKFSNKIIDLVGPQIISFENFVKRFVKVKNTQIHKIDLEKAYFDALNNPKKAVYSLDDLNIMIGDFTGNYKKLQKMCNFKIKTLKSTLNQLPF
jgi:NADH dehydrogenase